MLIGRREWIKSGLHAAGGCALIGAAGIRRLLAEMQAAEPKLSDELLASVSQLSGRRPQPAADDGSLDWEIPDKAEWGDRVPLLVSAEESAKSLSVFVERADEPLAFVYEPGRGARRTLAAPIRICATGTVAAVATYADRTVSRAATVYVPASAACRPPEPDEVDSAEGSISTKVRFRRGAARLEVRLRHPMTSDQHVRSLRVLRRDERILELRPTATLSADPVLTFRFDARRGEYLEVAWEDTRGLSASHHLRVR